VFDCFRTSFTANFVLLSIARLLFKYFSMSKALRLPVQQYYRIGVGMFFFIQGLVFSSWTSRIPDIKNTLQLSDGALGGILFALPIGQLTAMNISGYLVGRFGSKRVLSIAVLFYPAVLVLLGLVQSTWQLIGGLFLFGIAANLCNISINTQGVGVERIYRRSIMASFHGLWSLAGFTGGLIGQILVANHIPPFHHFIIMYVITGGIMLVARQYMLPRDAHHSNQQQPAPKRRIFVKPDKYIVQLGIIAFASMVCEGTMFDWSSIYFEKIVNAPTEYTRLGFIAFMCTMAGGRFAADYLVSRFGVSNIIQISGVVILTGMLLAVLFPTIYMSTLGFLLVGFGTSAVVPMTYSMAGKSKTMLPSVALASVSSIGFLGFLIGPPLIGMISELTNLRISFAVIAVLGLGTTVMARRLSKS
jgi:MFS family permease